MRQKGDSDGRDERHGQEGRFRQAAGAQGLDARRRDRCERRGRLRGQEGAAPDRREGAAEAQSCGGLGRRRRRGHPRAGEVGRRERRRPRRRARPAREGRRAWRRRAAAQRRTVAGRARPSREAPRGGSGGAPQSDLEALGGEMAIATQGTASNYLQRAPSPSGLADVVDLILDKGLVIDAYVHVAVIGIELITIDARIVIASVDTYLRFAEAVNHLDLAQTEAAGLAELRAGGGGGNGDGGGDGKVKG